MVLVMAPRMGMPKMDIVGMLSTMFGKENHPLGWMMHLMMGVVFALIYAFLWSRGILGPTLFGGLVFGAVHWLVVGMIMGMIPMVHAGIRRGDVKAPGLWMTADGGIRRVRWWATGPPRIRCGDGLGLLGALGQRAELGRDSPPVGPVPPGLPWSKPPEPEMPTRHLRDMCGLSCVVEFADYCDAEFFFYLIGTGASRSIV